MEIWDTCPQPKGCVEAGPHFGPRSVMEEQFSGYGGYQNHNVKGTVGSFSQGLHQVVWDVLQTLARMTSGKQTQESRRDWKRYHDRSPPRKFSSTGETTNAEQHLSENVCLLDLRNEVVQIARR